MGWDAHSCAEFDYENQRLLDPEIRRAFKVSHEYISNKTCSVDAGLIYGELGCKECAYMLYKAGINAWSDDIINSIDLNKKANWEFQYEDDEAWAYWSARKFIEVSAMFSIEVYFSY